MIRQALSVCVLVLVTSVSAAAQSTVFLVRHAERADGGMPPPSMTSPDPDLSAAGKTRAESLAALLKDARITAIYVTEFQRTRQTAAPLAQALGIEPTVVSTKEVASLAAKLEGARGNVLVVGHTNTLPEVLKSLGVSDTVTIGEQDFDNLFIVTRGTPPSFVRLHYR